MCASIEDGSFECMGDCKFFNLSILSHNKISPGQTILNRRDVQKHPANPVTDPAYGRVGNEIDRQAVPVGPVQSTFGPKKSDFFKGLLDLFRGHGELKQLCSSSIKDRGCQDRTHPYNGRFSASLWRQIDIINKHCLDFGQP